MTRYATAIAAIEAAGASAAALLPTRPDGTLPAGILTAAVILYAASLAPQFRAAIGARVPRTRQARRDGLAGAADYLTPAHPAVPALRRHRPGRHRVLRHRAPALGLAVSRSRAVGRGRAATLGTRSGFLRMPGPVGAMVAGAVLMLIASGPTRLSVGLAAQLHGHASVVIAAIAFTVGCLLASTAVDLLGRLRLPNTLTWPLWGIGMVIGWVAAPWQLAGLLIAQFLSGVSLTAFEGAMDARVAEDAGTGDVTAALAWSAATRATGGAVAVRALPLMVAAPAVGAYSGAAAAVLAGGGALVWAAVRVMRQRSGGTSGRLLAATG